MNRSVQNRLNRLEAALSRRKEQPFDGLEYFRQNAIRQIPAHLISAFHRAEAAVKRGRTLTEDEAQAMKIFHDNFDIWMNL